MILYVSIELCDCWGGRRRNCSISSKRLVRYVYSLLEDRQACDTTGASPGQEQAVKGQSPFAVHDCCVGIGESMRAERVPGYVRQDRLRRACQQIGASKKVDE